MARRTVVEVVKEAPKEAAKIEEKEPDQGKKAKRAAAAMEQTERQVEFLNGKKQEAQANEEIRAQLLERVRPLWWMTATNEELDTKLGELSRPWVETVAGEIRDVLTALNLAMTRSGGGLMVETHAMHLNVLERKWTVSREVARRIDAAHAKADSSKDPEDC